jgi:hypothetical protein
MTAELLRVVVDERFEGYPVRDNFVDTFAREGR